MRTIIRKTTLVTVDPKLGNLYNADLLIEDDKIAEVGIDLEVSDAEEVDGSNHLVMPGLVDAHRHIWQGPMRGVCADWSLFNYVGGIRMNAASAYQPQDMYAAQFQGALEALDAGVTTVTDYCHNLNTMDHAHESIRGVIESGLRVIWNFGFSRPPLEEPGFSTLRERVAFAKELAKTYFSGADQLVTMGIAPEERLLWPGTDTAVTQFKLAEELGSRIFWHTNSAKMDGAFPRDVAALKGLGLLNANMLFAHMNFTDDDEWQMVADAGAGVGMTPDTEFQMGMSWSPTLKAREFGVPQGYGIDITSNNSGDLFVSLRMALQAARCQLNQPHEGTIYDGVPITCAEALRWGTIDAARALGLDQKIGSLTPGKQADLVMLRMDSISMVGWDRQNPEGIIILQAGAKDVDTVFVAGRKVKENGRLLLDADRACRLLQEAHERVTKIVHDQGGFYVSPETALERMGETQTAEGAH